MGTGADVAIESAGVTLLKGDLTGIVKARRLSAAVMHNIRQNLFFAFVYNALGVPVAAGVLYPISGCRQSLPQPQWHYPRSASLPMRCACAPSGSNRRNRWPANRPRDI
jgi:hypothetical protein